MSGYKWRNRAVQRGKRNPRPNEDGTGTGDVELNRLTTERLTRLVEARADVLRRAQAGDLEALEFCYRHLRLRFPLVEARLPVVPWWMVADAAV